MANIELGAFKQVFDQTKAAQDLTNTKLDAAKTVLDTLATENKLDAVRALIEALNGLVATDDTLTQAKDALDLLCDVDFATDTELQEVTAALANVLIALTAIKNTDGIKKIVDALPSGTNTIGAVVPKDSEGNEIFTEEKPGQVQINGSLYELRGLLANRPDANAENILPGKTLYWAVDDGWVYASNGTAWKKVVEVGAWKD
jgi:hypothetical protein